MFSFNNNHKNIEIEEEQVQGQSLFNVMPKRIRNLKDISIDPLLFLFIPRSPKIPVKILQLSNLFQAKFYFHFCFHHPLLSFSYHNKASCLCHTKVFVSVSFMVFQSQRSLVDKQVRCNVLTAKKSVHANGKLKYIEITSRL